MTNFLFLNLSYIRRSSRKSLNPWWILFNNKSTTNVFCNQNIIQDLRHAYGHHIFLHFSAVLQICTKESNLPGFGMVWFDEGGISNILYFSNFKDKHNVRYYCDEDIYEFLKPTHKVFLNTSVGGLYYHDAWYQ